MSTLTIEDHELVAAAFVPYSVVRPKTTDVRVLREELHRVRSLFGRRSSQAKEAYDALNAASHLAGQPLDGLRRYSIVESERFFARTVPGPEGHVYWTGGKSFGGNGGKSYVPRRWWWGHLHGPLVSYNDVVPTCGDRACINPEHCATGRGLSRTRHSDSALIGKLQVTTMRLGHVPSQREWDSLGLEPSHSAIKLRFGNWGRFVSSAGLEMVSQKTWTKADCIAAVQLAKKLLGHWPSGPAEYGLVAREITAAGLPANTHALWRHIGLWPEILRAAGKRS